MYDIQPCVLQPEARHRQAAGNSAERQNTASCDVTYIVAEAIFKCRNAFWAAAWQVHMLEVATLPFEPTGIHTGQVQITDVCKYVSHVTHMDHHAIHVKCIPEAMGIGGAGELYGEADIAMMEFPKVSVVANLSEESFAVV